MFTGLPEWGNGYVVTGTLTSRDTPVRHINRAVDDALDVLLRVEWLTFRPAILPIVAPEFNTISHIGFILEHLRCLRERVITVLVTEAAHASPASSAVSNARRVVQTCRSFTERWQAEPKPDRDQFNDAVRGLRWHLDTITNPTRHSTADVPSGGTHRS